MYHQPYRQGKQQRQQKEQQQDSSGATYEEDGKQEKQKQEREQHQKQGQSSGVQQGHFPLKIDEPEQPKPPPPPSHTQQQQQQQHQSRRKLPSEEHGQMANHALPPIPLTTSASCSTRQEEREKRASTSPPLKRAAIVNNPATFVRDAGRSGLEETPQLIFKNKQTRDLLVQALRGHFLFAALDPSDLEGCVDVMRALSFPRGQMVITQGETGDKFYVLEDGVAECIVNGDIVAKYGPGGSFGELALMYNCERAASIRTVTPCRLWSVDLRTFRQTLAKSASTSMVTRCDFLRKVTHLDPLGNDQLNKLAGALESRKYNENEYIVRQGEVGDTFFLIESGTVQCTQYRSSTDTTELPLLTLTRGDYFGEMALMLEEPRAANCIAVGGPVNLLTLNRNHFFQLLGPVQDIMRNYMRLRILQSVPLLKDLSHDDLCAVADSLCVQSFEDGEHIVRQGEEGTRFFIINEGDVVCTRNEVGPTGGEKELLCLGKSEFFGQRELLHNERADYNYVARGAVDCLVLHRQNFLLLLKEPLGPVLSEDVRRREEQTGLQTNTVRQARSDIELTCLVKVCTLGKGTFGRVKMVKHTPTEEYFALKCLMKAQIAKSHQHKNILNEKNILMACDHPFIVKLYATFNTVHELFMLTEVVLGGELWSYIYDPSMMQQIPRSSFGGFATPAAMFYVASVVLCLQYLHHTHIAYRDIKPENLLISEAGYLKMIDFGFAKVLKAKSFTLCGTPDYLAPELILSRGHTKSVDYWALGCLTYELLCGRTPFAHTSHSEIFKKAIGSERFLVFPPNFDPKAADLIRRLLNQNDSYRLGNLRGGVRDIMDHEWFEGSPAFDWQELLSEKSSAPLVPVQTNQQWVERKMADDSSRDAGEQADLVVEYTGPQSLFHGF